MSKNVKAILILATFILYFLVSNITLSHSLSTEGQKAILLMIIAIIWWVLELVPISLSALLFPMLLSFLGILPEKEALQSFFSSTLVFIFASSIIGKIFSDIGLGRKISKKVVHMLGAKPQHVLLSFMISTSLISTFMVDIPTAVIFSSIGYELLILNKCLPGKSSFGKSLMMGIPIASALGGFGTPAGSGINVLAINLMEQSAGIKLSFLNWTLIGLPSAIFLTVISWYILIKLYPPEIDEVYIAESYKNEDSSFNKEQIKFTVIFILTMICWFSGIMPIPLTGIIAASFMFFPGIQLSSWEKVSKAISIDVLFLIGSSQAMGYAIYSTGAAHWIATTLLSDIQSVGIIGMLLIISSFGVFSHLILPVASAVLSVCIPVLAIIASSNEISPAMLILPIAFTASCVFLLPLDPIPLTTHKYGYWKIYEISLPGLLISMCWIVVNVTAMIFASRLGII